MQRSQILTTGLLLAAVLHMAASQQPAIAQQQAAPPQEDAQKNQAGDNQTETAADTYSPPDDGRIITDQDAPRPLLLALREAGESLRDQAWSSSTSREMGRHEFSKSTRGLFENETVNRIQKRFREGYTQIFAQVPEVVQLTAVEMDSAEAAREYYSINLTILKMRLEGTNQTQGLHATVLGEESLALVGLDEAFEQRYEMVLEDAPPTRFRTLFGRADRFFISVNFVQSDVEETTARHILASLGNRVLVTAPHRLSRKPNQ